MVSERERLADEYRKNFKWQGVVNRLRTAPYAAKIGFLAGLDAMKLTEEERGVVEKVRTVGNNTLAEYLVGIIDRLTAQATENEK